MSQDLRDALHRVADDVPAVRVDPRTWDRARRARRRDRVVLPALATVLVLAGLAALTRPGWQTDPLPPVDRPVVGGAGALPDHLYEPPESWDHLREDGSRSRPLEPVSAVGRASAAYVTQSGVPVLVSAHDGRHLRVDLPGFVDRFAGMEDGTWVAVSPDGTRVAYPWRLEPRPQEGRWPSGFAVVDLERPGRPEVHRLPGGDGVRVSDLAWSPDGRYLVYRAAVAGELRYYSFSSREGYLERFDTSTGDRRRLGRDTGSPPAVSDTGVVATMSDGLVLWTARPGTGPARREIPVADDPSGPPAWSADGSRVALGSFGVAAGFTVADVAAGTSELVGDLEPGATKVLGWVGPDHVLTVRHPSSWTDSDLVLVDVRSGRARTVGVAEGQVSERLSVATGLMTVERPTVRFAPPEWEHGRTWWWVGGGALGVVIGGLVLVGLRRRRH